MLIKKKCRKRQKFFLSGLARVFVKEPDRASDHFNIGGPHDN